MRGDDASKLLEWYDRHRRELPWRGTRDPYQVWLSEVMLQQTRVETVLPYYQRFLDRFPTLSALAEADLEEVLGFWSGLGYYRRARQMHRASREILERGGFPQTVEGLLELPGIGPYTAAAVASIVFDIAVPVVDGNVERLTARLLSAGEDPKSKDGRRRLRAKAEELLDPGRPGDSNQALMELGATLCTPRSPRCPICPLRESCRARAEGRPERYPIPRSRRKIERIRRAVVLVFDSAGARGHTWGEMGAVLLFRRADDASLLAGTWELPWVDLPGEDRSDDDSENRASTIVRGLSGRYGGSWRIGPHLGRVRHGITYRAIEIEIYRGIVDLGVRTGSTDRPASGFFDPRARSRLPQSSLVSKVLSRAARLPERG